MQAAWSDMHVHKYPKLRLYSNCHRSLIIHYERVERYPNLPLLLFFHEAPKCLGVFPLPATLLRSFLLLTDEPGLEGFHLGFHPVRSER
jgi:hypothetical protein